MRFAFVTTVVAKLPVPFHVTHQVSVIVWSPEFVQVSPKSVFRVARVCASIAHVAAVFLYMTVHVATFAILAKGRSHVT